MAPAGYLDVHSHFYLPMTDEEAASTATAMTAADFLIHDPSILHWTADKALAHQNLHQVSMQLLSYIPAGPEKLRAANDFAHRTVQSHPGRFGHLAALPTSSAELALAELERVTSPSWSPAPDGFALSTVYDGVSLADPTLTPLWQQMHDLRAVVHVHPNAYAPGTHGLPSPVVEVAFDTARTVTAMLYAGVFTQYPDITWIFAHCGGALPALSGRLALLGGESWVPNQLGLTGADIEKTLRRLWVDTAATARTGLAPAVEMVGIEHVVYGADSGVPCSCDRTIGQNKADVEAFEQKLGVPAGSIRESTWRLFPEAAKRAQATGEHGKNS